MILLWIAALPIDAHLRKAKVGDKGAADAVLGHPYSA